MYITMKEYLAAKNIDIDKLPIIFKTATGIHERIVFKGGIMAQLMRGKHHGKRCVWFPNEAKQVNKILECQIFASTATGNLICENNNYNVNIFEIFGDVSVFWTVPNNDKIIKHLVDGLKGQFKSSQFVGHSIIINLRNLGEYEQALVNNKDIVIESKNHDDITFREKMSTIVKHFETSLSIDFMKKLYYELSDVYQLKFAGYDGHKLYFINELDELFILTYWVDDRLNNLCKKLSFTSEKLIDDFESTRF